MISIMFIYVKKIFNLMVAVLLKNRFRRTQFLFMIIILTSMFGLMKYSKMRNIPSYGMKQRMDIKASIEDNWREQLKLDKGTGCEMPVLDPFAKEVMQFDKQMPKVQCDGQDWVKCYFSECKVIGEILDTYSDISCTYRDIIYENDDKYSFGIPVDVIGADAYHLTRSDHVVVSCTGRSYLRFPGWWSGLAAGFRRDVTRVPPPKGREYNLNVLIFAFDSTSRNGFIRRVPKSYDYLKETMQATILKSYNIVGDGTPAAMLPILTGKNELELPDVRKKIKNNRTCDEMPFIFYKLRDDGYRTSYLEDLPSIGTFQYRFTGFRHQPADHYQRAFLLELLARRQRWWSQASREYCVGDTPLYRFMMNLTNQFLHLDGKKFALTFIADITHNDFNLISTADDDFVDFMTTFRNEGLMEDTLLIVMGDHGPRYANVRNTLQGRLEERLPLMAWVLPEQLKAMRPEAMSALRANTDVLTTPHDVHATLLDVLDMRQYANPYKIPGADLPRGMSLLKPIPRNRSCSEAGIEPHWCACLRWQNVSRDDPNHHKAAQAFVGYINSLTEPVRHKCAIRTLSSVSWVMKQRANSRMLSFVEAKDSDGYVGKFGEQIPLQKETYQVKVTVNPGKSDFEATMTYLTDKDEFHIDSRDISRTNKYGSEPHCVSATYPHLNPYCYCIN